MVKFQGFDENGQVVVSEQKTHQYSDLPMKGLGKDMSSVGLNEPVTIPQSATIDSVIWGYTMAEIERRCNELSAKASWRELPPQSPSDGVRFEMWFS